MVATPLATDQLLEIQCCMKCCTVYFVLKKDLKRTYLTFDSSKYARNSEGLKITRYGLVELICASLHIYNRAKQALKSENMWCELFFLFLS